MHYCNSRTIAARFLIPALTGFVPPDRPATILCRPDSKSGFRRDCNSKRHIRGPTPSISLLMRTWAHPEQQRFSRFRDPGAERGNSDFDVRHRLVVNSIYELPFGHGKKFFGQAGGFANQVVGGWQVANIVSVSSGNWYTVLDSNGNFANADGGAGGVSQRPTRSEIPKRRGRCCCNPGCVAPGRISNPKAWFNTVLSSTRLSVRLAMLVTKHNRIARLHHLGLLGLQEFSNHGKDKSRVSSGIFQRSEPHEFSVRE